MKITAKHVGFGLSGSMHLAILAAVVLVKPPVPPSTTPQAAFELDLALFEPSAERPAPTAEPKAEQSDVIPSGPPPRQPLADRQPAEPEPDQQAAPIARPQPEPKPSPRPRPSPKLSPKPKRLVQQAGKNQAPEPAKTPAPAASTLARKIPQVIQPSIPPTTAASSPQGEAHEEPTTSSKQLERVFLADLAKRINRYKFYPKASRRRAERGTVVIAFTVEKTGHVRDARIETSSGYKRLDRAALATLAKAGPFRPIPEALAMDRWSLSVPIAYALR